MKEEHALAVESVTVQHCIPPPEPPPLADYKDIVVSNNAYTGPEKNPTMGLATAKRGRARTAMITFKENIFLF